MLLHMLLAYDIWIYAWYCFADASGKKYRNRCSLLGTGGDNTNILLIKSTSLGVLIQNVKSTDLGLPLSERAIKLLFLLPRRNELTDLQRGKTVVCFQILLTLF